MRLLLICLLISFQAWSQKQVPEDLDIKFEILSSFARELDTDQANLKPKLTIEKPTAGPDYSEGTGTRGGGSGILTQREGEDTTVTLLDIYRSKNREHFPLFYEIDPVILKLNESEAPRDEVARKIFLFVVERTQKLLPALAQRILLVERIIPFDRWTPSLTHLPLIDDFIGGNIIREGQKHVQIAYRKNDQIIYDEQLYNLMDGLNRAALYLHEYLYAHSSKKDSLSIQRLVSLLLSSRMGEDDFKEKSGQIFFDLKLNSLATDSMTLPEGASLTTKEPTKNQVCGVISQIRAHPEDKTITLRLELNPKYEQFTSEMINEDFKESMRYRKLIEKRLDVKETYNFMMSIYAAKGFLSTIYPIFVFPSQSVLSDIVCVDKKTSAIASVEASLSYHKKKNELDMMDALLEASYFKTQRDYILNPGPELKRRFHSIEVLILRNRINSLQYLALDQRTLDEEAEKLGSVRIKLR